MASANVIFGKVSGDLPLIDGTNFTSETVASGAADEAAPSGTAAVRVTTIGSAMYAAFSTGTPDPTQHPRVYIPADSAVEFGIGSGVKVGVADV